MPSLVPGFNLECSKIPVTGMNETYSVALVQTVFEEKTDSTFNTQSSKDYFNSCPSAQKELLKKACNNFYAVSDKSGVEEFYGYSVCCKANEICPPQFYTQIWFFAACGGFVLLLIIIILIVIICCRKK
ncbi:unnamed protein product [Caenorhabditis nigoni]